ncbi:hypothetical protein E2562_028459 [Oryza meyeriana var. granulata]|uniref:Uncharacterized protein n=1 Tax=Oryza meyeriana var. granulata TaxID=110450 RepID=A0A6G1E3A8_9ORYZ|nr:hypothetical protein E2562_028459 [Oryza meyeriana var. granulata]
MGNPNQPHNVVLVHVLHAVTRDELIVTREFSVSEACIGGGVPVGVGGGSRLAAPRPDGHSCCGGEGRGTEQQRRRFLTQGAWRRWVPAS